jgi:AcrR family transcriptional regulator
MASEHALETHVANPPDAAKPVRADSRQATLVRAAYDLIVERGLEGLRTRDIAARAGVNVATLHYHFPTKEALIGGVAEFLCTQFVSVHAAPVAGSGSPALDRLRQEFADTRHYHSVRPDMLTVMHELILRARRDEAVRAIVAPLVGYWREGIAKMIAAGQAEGVFRAELAPETASTLVITALSGVILLGLPPPAIDHVIAEIERTLLVPGQRNGRAVAPQEAT